MRLVVGAVAALSIWHWLLKDPQGIDGLVVGVIANLIAFSAMHRIDWMVEAEAD